MYVLQLYTGLEAELDHRQGGVRSGAGCPPSESSGTKVHARTADRHRGIIAFYALLHDTPLRS